MPLSKTAGTRTVETEPRGFEAVLLAAAQSRSDQVALRFKSRGAWLAWTWRDVVKEVDRFASFLRAQGIGPGIAIAIVGEIRPAILFGALAASALGVDVVSVAPGAPVAQIKTVLDQNRVGLAIVQGRRALAAWLQVVSSRHARTAIVFDHVTPAGTSPEDDVIPLAAVTATSPAHGWADRLGTSGPLPQGGGAELWVEASTAWPEALHVLIGNWIGSGETLAAPELLAAAARDRAEIRPRRWIASSGAAAAASADITRRLAGKRSLTAALSRRSAALRALLLILARRRLGLSRLKVIEVQRSWQPPEQRSAEEATFRSVGVALRVAAHEGADARAARTTNPFETRLAAVGGAS